MDQSVYNLKLQAFNFLICVFPILVDYVWIGKNSICIIEH